MYKTVIAGITAASMTLAAAQPVQAQSLSEDQIGKILFGLVATAVVASIIDNNNDDKSADVVTERRNAWQQPDRSPRVTQPRHDQPRVNQPRHEQPRIEQPRNSLVIPSQCLASYKTRYGTVRMFVRSCMRENYRRTGSLPTECNVRALTTEGPRNGWDPTCLRDKGYRISRLR